MDSPKIKLKLGLILFKNFHYSKNWVSAITPKFIEKLFQKYDTYWIESQSDYEKTIGDLDFLISYEPGWSSPMIDFHRNSKISDKFSSIPTYIILSDPHNKKWREEYLIKNDINFVLTYYYTPFIYHFKNIPIEKIIHFPWSIPDEWIPKNKVIFHNDSKVKCFGAVNSEAYIDRKWCMSFPFVETFENSGVENKIMTDEDYFIWLSQIDAAVAAGSLERKYRLTLPKYFEVLSVGALLFAQKTDDLSRLGFKHQENCLIFDRTNFLLLVKTYLENPYMYLKIRENGKKLIMDLHTQSKRLEAFNNHLEYQIALRKSERKNKNIFSTFNLPQFSSPSEIYLANADRMDKTLENIKKLERCENSKIERYLTVIGGFSGLNYLLELEPDEIVLFDLNKFAVVYSELILEIIQISSSPEEFISRIFSRSVDEFLNKNGFKSLCVENQDQYLEVPYDINILEDTVKKLSIDAKKTFKEYIEPFLSGRILEGKRNCRRLLPCWPINKRVPVGGGEDTGYNENGIREPNTNTFFYGYGWLSSNISFNCIKTRLKKANVVYLNIDLLKSSTDILFENYNNCVLHYSNIDDWFPEQHKLKIIEWREKVINENKSLTLISSVNGIINFQPDPHHYAYRTINKHIFGENLVEVTHKIPWGFNEFKRQNILIDDYIIKKGVPCDTTILHILYGEGCTFEQVIASLYYAVKNSKRVLLLEHNKNSADWIGKEHILDIKQFQDILNLTISDVKTKTIKIEFVRGINDSKRNVLFVIDNHVTDFSPSFRNKFDWIDASMKGVEKFISEKNITRRNNSFKRFFMGVLQKPSDIQDKGTKKNKNFNILR